MTTTEQYKLADQIAHSIEAVLGQILLHPDRLRIDTTVASNRICLTGKCHKADMPRVIGEGGMNFTTMQALCSMMGQAHGVDVRLYPFSEPIDIKPLPLTKPKWDAASVLCIVAQICKLASGASPAACGHSNPNSIYRFKVWMRGLDKETAKNISVLVQHLLDSIGRNHKTVCAFELDTHT